MNKIKFCPLILFFSTSVFATPSVSVKTNYYAIHGSTENELRQEMNSKSTGTQNGKTFDAYTSWDINWRFNWDSNNGKCHITTVSSNLDVVFTFPKWMNRDKAGQKLLKKWNLYNEALIRHENGHKKFGVQAVEEIEKEILGMTASCSSLERKANETGNKILNKYIALEKKYDMDTEHGMKEGAVFP